jgi:hypothetical protein
VTDHHQHAGFTPPPGYADPAARQVDHELLGRLVGAAFDSCPSCQDAHLTLCVEDPAATARLVELACVGVQQALGGLPGNLISPARPGLASLEFRKLARAGLDGSNDELFRACERLTIAERRAAANTALDLLTGLLAGGADA